MKYINIIYSRSQLPNRTLSKITCYKIYCSDWTCTCLTS